MGRLREFKVMLVGAKDAPAHPISILAQTATIAIYRAATLALDFDATDFSVLPGKRASWSRL